jgi:hypothetical protein
MTIKQVLKSRLPEPIANSAIFAIQMQHIGPKQIPHDADDVCTNDSLDEALHSFHWDSTDEGHQYWYTIHKKYVRDDERDSFDNIFASEN